MPEESILILGDTTSRKKTMIYRVLYQSLCKMLGIERVQLTRKQKNDIHAAACRDFSFCTHSSLEGQIYFNLQQITIFLES